MEDLFHLGAKGIIKNSSGNILLLQKHPDKRCGTEWDLPGGRIHKGESFQEGLKREIFEETQIDNLSDIEFISMELVPFRIPIKDHDVGLIFAVHSCFVPDETKITLSDEHVDYKWVTPQEAANLLKPSYPKKTVEHLICMPL